MIMGALAFLNIGLLLYSIRHREHDLWVLPLIILTQIELAAIFFQDGARAIVVLSGISSALLGCLRILLVKEKIRHLPNKEEG